MRMFTPPDVGGGLSDFWSYVRQPRPHRWAIWGVVMALTYLVFSGITKYIVRQEEPKPQIIYFENWTAKRTDAESRADWVDRAKETTLRNAETRAEYQRLADMLGVDYDSAEADKVTRETLGEEAAAAAKKKPEPPKQSTLAERAARGARPPAQTPPAKAVH